MIARRPDVPAEIVYPESDGKPMADNTRQARWMVVIYGGLSALFRDRADVFVAMNLFWYPEEGHPEVRTAPDGLVVFGRPKGDRPSYVQWLEGNIPPQVVFEILSPGNGAMEMMNKLMFYEDHGVEEYYLYDPDANELAVYQRRGTVLTRVRNVRNWASPRLGIRFDLSGPEMVIYHPNGERFKTFEEVTGDLEAEKQQRLLAEQARDEATRRADQAEQARDQATQRAEQANQARERAAQEAQEARERAARLAERLRQAGLDPDA